MQVWELSGTTTIISQEMIIIRKNWIFGGVTTFKEPEAEECDIESLYKHLLLLIVHDMLRRLQSQSTAFYTV